MDAPFDARGIMLMTYRYKASDAPQGEHEERRHLGVRPEPAPRAPHLPSAQRTDAVSGTDFTIDDLRSFHGIVPQYEWTCLGEMDIIAPMNSKVQAYPYDHDHNFGPFGLSFADDPWELRKAVKFRFVPEQPRSPLHHKDIYIDRQTRWSHSTPSPTTRRTSSGRSSGTTTAGPGTRLSRSTSPGRACGAARLPR